MEVGHHETDASSEQRYPEQRVFHRGDKAPQRETTADTLTQYVLFGRDRRVDDPHRYGAFFGRMLGKGWPQLCYQHAGLLASPVGALLGHVRNVTDLGEGADLDVFCVVIRVVGRIDVLDDFFGAI